MDIRKAVVAAVVVAAAAIGSADVAVARTYVNIEIAPPAPRYEPVPPPRAGYVWVPGIWAWDGHRHSWHRGHWMRERHGYTYIGPLWYEDHGRWRYDDGRWERHHRG